MAAKTFAQRLSPVSAARRGPVLCKHCNLVVPPGVIEAENADQFCCHGCETAYSIIHTCGLERYYELRQQLDDRAPAPGTDRTYNDFDDETFRRLHTRQIGVVTRCELFLHGVHCSACLWLIERLPRMVNGLIEARLDLRRGIVDLAWDDRVVKLSHIARTLASIGYPPQPARDRKSRANRVAEDRRQLVRLAAAGAIAANVMLFALALYAGIFDAMEPSHRTMFRWLSMVLTVLSLVWPGAVFFKSSWAAIRTRTPHIDVPIALALFAGGAWSVFTTIKGSGEIYFDTVSVLVFALLAGRFFQSRQQRASADDVELLFSLTPSSAHRVEGDTTRDVPIESLQPGDVVQVLAGDSMPCDGEVDSGESLVDESLLSGESRPVRVAAGNNVAAGTLNISAELFVRVQTVGEETRVGQLMRLVADGAQRKAPIVRFADVVGAWFTLGMLALAAVTLGLWLWLEPLHAVDHAVALLVVTCPCALGLATPIVITIATGRAARRGMLIKGGDVIQSLSKPGVMILDKTGTLTTGGLAVVAWHGDDSVRAMVYAVESTSNHPVAKALARDLADPCATQVRVTSTNQVLGCGIEAVASGRRVVIGSLSFVSTLARVTLEHADLARRWAAEGITPILVAVDGVSVALAALGDGVRPEARATLDELRRRGWQLRIASGDHQDVVTRVGSALGFTLEDCLGGLSPEAKLTLVERIKATLQPRSGRRLVMVGDGVNDAAALAAADVGIAVHGGAEASLAACDVYLSRPGIGSILELLDGCARSMNVIRRNLWVSLFYNTIAAGIAVAGLLNPLIAAVVMPISSLSALAVSLKSRTFADLRRGADTAAQQNGSLP